MSRSSKNLRAKHRRRLRAERAEHRKMKDLAMRCAALAIKVQSEQRAREAAVSAVFNLLPPPDSPNTPPAFYVKVIKSVQDGLMVRGGYRAPSFALNVHAGVDHFARLAEHIPRFVASSPAIRVPSWANEFWKVFSLREPESAVYIRHAIDMLGLELAHSIFANICQQSVELAAKLKEVGRAD